MTHDATNAENSLLDSLKEGQEKWKAKQLKNKHDEFLAHIIKDLLAEINTEQQISQEFIQDSHSQENYITYRLSVNSDDTQEDLN